MKNEKTSGIKRHYSKWFTKLKVCWLIVTGKYGHWIIMNVDGHNLEQLLKDEPYNIDSHYCGLQPYIFFRMIQYYGSLKDDIDMALDKAQFESDAIESAE